MLYYRVPRWPLVFGDNDKARELLTQAVSLAPNGMDANYFYADFLISEREYAAAYKVLRHALSLPPQQNRPLWDKNLARRDPRAYGQDASQQLVQRPGPSFDAVWHGIGAQLRNPSGLWGQLAGNAMAVANARPNALAVAALGMKEGEELARIGLRSGLCFAGAASLAAA